MSIWFYYGVQAAVLVVLGYYIAIPVFTAFRKGAPFVPTSWGAARRVAEAANPKDGEVVLDPGCGDARLLTACAERAKIRGIGYELFGPAYLLARWRNHRDRSGFELHRRDSRKASWKDVDIIVIYFLPESMKALKGKFLADLRPGARIVSYAFRIEGWEHVRMLERVPERNIAPIWVYEIGAGTP